MYLHVRLSEFAKLDGALGADLIYDTDVSFQRVKIFPIMFLSTFRANEIDIIVVTRYTVTRGKRVTCKSSTLRLLLYPFTYIYVFIRTPKIHPQ